MSAASPAVSLSARIAWAVLALLSFAIAGYALSIVFRPQVSPLAGQLVAAHPWLAPLHFAGGGIALALGSLQWVRRLQLQRPAIHRWLGRVYVTAVVSSGSAGLVMAMQTSAGRVAAAGFSLLAILWLWTTLRAYLAIRARQVARHRAWMLRSFALTLAAVTLRLYLPASQLADWSFEVAYPAIAWLCWVPNLMVAEVLVRWRRWEQV